MSNRIAELEKKIQLLNNTTQKQTDSVWSVLDDRTKGLTAQEVEAIMSSKEVLQSKGKMLDAFVQMFLFSKYRNEFINIPSFRPLCEEYVNSVLNAKSGLYKHSIELEEENKRLKEELEKIRGHK